MYSKLVFYMEACESGSMFEGQLPTDMNIYVTTASNAEESSWGTYCPPDDSVNGKELQSCLGDLYSVNWMENSDSAGMSETLDTQFTVVKQLTTQSHVMQYGDITWTSQAIGDFQGDKAANKTVEAVPEVKKSSSNVDSRDIKLNYLYYKYVRTAKTDLAAVHENGLALQAEVSHRLKADSLFLQLSKELLKENYGAIFAGKALKPYSSPCSEQAHAAVQTYCGGYSDYSMQYARVVHNVCNKVGDAQKVVSTIKSLCQ
jgi:legumain